MARVDITLNGRAYALACEDGQEGRLRELAGFVAERLAEIAADTSGGSEAQILVLTTLVLADEIYDLQREMELLRKSRDPTVPNRAAEAAAAEEEGERVASVVDVLAKRIEDIAQRLERA